MSFTISNFAASELQLSQAILLYKHRNNNVAYATIHPVGVSENGCAMIRAGRPADSRAIRSVCADLLSSAKTRSGLLSSNVLSVGMSHIVWWSPPQQRTYYFDCRPRGEGPNVGQRSGIAPAPGLIFVGGEKRLWVFAMKGKERPTADTPLFHAPLMNVYDNGSVCTGSMPMPDATLSASAELWEQSFWQSAFSHPNHQKPVRYRKGLHQFSIDLLDGKFKTRFPERVLEPLGDVTLGQLIDRLDTEGMR